jgi:1-aminocyclopropane-1-carboxylate deaminase
MLNYKNTPVSEIFEESFDKAGVRVFVKREDLNHERVSGNKWWKLKYNLEEAKNLRYETLLTFGGAFSNHIFATAAAANELGFKSIGVIRGEETIPINNTLSFAKNCGMQLHYVSRDDYKMKTSIEFMTRIENLFGNFYLILEGGTNPLAVKGCAEFAKTKLQDVDFDYLCLPVGTGGTIAGIIAGLAGEKNIIGFPVLKNGNFLVDEIRELVKNFSGRNYSNWKLETDYHFGGYAKHAPELDQFILRMHQKHNLSLEFVYTGKMVAGVYDLIRKSRFRKGSKILILHSGGLRN